MSCELLKSSPTLSGFKSHGVDALRYNIASHLSDQKVVWSQNAVVIRVITHSC